MTSREGNTPKARSDAEPTDEAPPCAGRFWSLCSAFATDDGLGSSTVGDSVIPSHIEGWGEAPAPLEDLVARAPRQQSEAPVKALRLSHIEPEAPHCPGHPVESDTSAARERSIELLTERVTLFCEIYAPEHSSKAHAVASHYVDTPRELLTALHEHYGKVGSMVAPADGWPAVAAEPSSGAFPATADGDGATAFKVRQVALEAFPEASSHLDVLLERFRGRTVALLWLAAERGCDGARKMLADSPRDGALPEPCSSQSQSTVATLAPCPIAAAGLSRTGKEPLDAVRCNPRRAEYFEAAAPLFRSFDLRGTIFMAPAVSVSPLIAPQGYTPAWCYVSATEIGIATSDSQRLRSVKINGIASIVVLDPFSEHPDADGFRLEPCSAAVGAIVAAIGPQRAVWVAVLAQGPEKLAAVRPVDCARDMFVVFNDSLDAQTFLSAIWIARHRWRIRVGDPQPLGSGAPRVAPGLLDPVRAVRLLAHSETLRLAVAHTAFNTINGAAEVITATCRALWCVFNVDMIDAAALPFRLGDASPRHL